MSGNLWKGLLVLLLTISSVPWPIWFKKMLHYKLMLVCKKGSISDKENKGCPKYGHFFLNQNILANIIFSVLAKWKNKQQWKSMPDFYSCPECIWICWINLATFVHVGSQCRRLFFLALLLLLNGCHLVQQCA